VRLLMQKSTCISLSSLLVFILVLGIGGCVKSQTPVEVMAEYSAAEMKMDTATMKSYCTERFNNSLMGSMMHNATD